MSNVIVIDLVTILIIFIPALVCAYRGFIKSVLGILPLPLGIFCAWKFSPRVTAFFRTTKFYSGMRDKIISSITVDDAIAAQVAESQSNFISSAEETINSIPLPDFIRETLIENNNSVVYGLLDADGLKEYIGGFLANICINIIVVVLIIIAVVIVLNIIIAVLDLFAKLPVLNFFNKGLGFIVGGIGGLIIVWIIGMILTYNFCSPATSEFLPILQQTKIAGFLYENNLLMFLIVNIFT